MAIKSNTHSQCAFDLFINDCFPIESSSGIDEICFIMMVHVDGLSYLVQRGKEDFIEFDKRIRKKYPKCEFPQLSFEEETSTPRKDNVFYMSKNKNMAFMNSYLKQIILSNEILSSDEFYLLLDEEIPAHELFITPSGSSVTKTLHDILLLPVEMNECIVVRSKEVSFEVQPDSVILWQFSTESYDIGFCVEIDGVVKVSYTRYQSHEKSVRGILEAKTSGNCVLTWDNSYSLFHTKKLKWAAQVVTSEQYYTACELIRELARKRKTYEKQRLAVRKCLFKRTLKSGVIQNFEGMDETELDEESSKLEAAQNEAQMLRQRIANLESELSEAVDARAAAEASRDEIAASWQYSLAQLEAARREVRALTQTNQELASRIAAREGLDGSNDYSDLDSTSQYYDRDVSDGWDSKSQPRLSIDESIINNNEIKT